MNTLATNISIDSAVCRKDGLRCFYAGFVVVAERDDRISRLIGLPETHEIYGALALGHPLLKFKNWVERKPARVTWM